MLALIRRPALLAGLGLLAATAAISGALAQTSTTPKGAPTPFGQAPAAGGRSSSAPTSKLPLGSAPAAQEPPPPGTKVVLANIQEAISTTQEGKKELTALQTKFAPEQEALKKMNDEVERMKADLALMTKGLSADDRSKRQKAIEDKTAAMKTRFEATQKEYQKAETDAVNRLGQKMLKVIESYSSAKGYDLVVDVSNPQIPLLWARQRIIITAALVEAYDKQYPIK